MANIGFNKEREGSLAMSMRTPDKLPQLQQCSEGVKQSEHSKENNVDLNLFSDVAKVKKVNIHIQSI